MFASTSLLIQRNPKHRPLGPSSWPWLTSESLALAAEHCDERRPACYKCEVSKRECLGYRDENELRFKSRGLRIQQSKVEPAQPHVATADSAYHVLPPSLSANLDDMVLCSYMSNFVIAKAPERELGIIDSALGPLLDVMGPIYARYNSTGPSCSAMLAMAWATTKPFAGAQYSMQQARIKYMETISRLKAAVQDPITASSDDTLLAVLLVSWIEVITSTPKLMPPVGKHVAGAIAIVNLRGKENFSSQQAKKMLAFVKLRSSINPVANAPGHPPYPSLTPEVIRYDIQNSEISNKPKDAPLRLGNLAMETSSLQGDLLKAMPSMTYPSDMMAIESILAKCFDLDQKFLAWREALPTQWEVSSPWFRNDQVDMGNRPSPSNTAFHLSHMFTYPTHHIAEMYNQYRLHRMKVQVRIMKCAFKIAASHKYQSQDYAQASTIHRIAHRVCLDTVNDICASVPFHFGEKPLQFGPTSNAIPEPTPNLESQSPSRHNPPQPFLRKNMGFYMLLQPLLFAQAVTEVPDQQREWVLAQAMKICQRTGMDSEMIRMRFEHMTREWKINFWPLDGLD